MHFALDIGGTTIRVAAAEDLSSALVTSGKKISASNNYDLDVEHIISVINGLRNGKGVTEIGIGFPGTFSDDKKTILVAPNLSSWNGREFVNDLEDEFHCKVLIENDDTIAALGEAIYGFGKGKDFVYITWGTGFGGAEVKQQDGKIQVRQFEAGHQIIIWKGGLICGCGQIGCAEAYIGGGNIENYYKKKVSELEQSEWEEIIDHLANALLNVVAFYPTKHIILGGGVAIRQKDKAQEIQKKIAQRLRIHPVPEVHITELGDDLGLMGAFALLKNRQ